MYPKLNRSVAARVNIFNKAIDESNRGVWCGCIINQSNELTSQTTSGNTSRAMRKSQGLRAAVGVGGRIQFGNYTGPQIVNYLGKVEGQAGGSGIGPRNKF